MFRPWNESITTTSSTFWVVAREGGLVPAGRLLHVSHPTLSAQIHSLEERLSEKLFVKVGRKRQLTEAGKLVYGYSEEIFSLGREMLDAVKGRGGNGRPARLNVGIVDVVPRLVVKHLLQPVLELPQPVRLVCHEDSPDRLLAELSLHTLDLVISDAPVVAGGSVRAFNHLLGETHVSLFGTQALVERYRKNFPARSTARRCCCRSKTPRCAARSTSGSIASRCGRRWWPSSKTAPCSRCSAETAWASSLPPR